MKLVYAGFDTIDIAIKGAFPQGTIELLTAARETAATRNEPTLLFLGDRRVAVHVLPGGRSGGYSIQVDTGPSGQILAIKANSDPNQWNLFASVRAASLACYRYPSACDRLWDCLRDMGAHVVKYTVNRIDYAMDFLIPGFTLNLDLFVAHPAAQLRVILGDQNVEASRDQLIAIFRGRQPESVLIGKMPGRQICVYNKRREAIIKRKLFWFSLWGIDRNDSTADVWRVELRAGKHELKDRWNVKTLEDVNASIGDVLRYAIGQVRYLNDAQTDSNVSRQDLHPLWCAATEHVENALFEFRSGLLPSQVREIERDLAIHTYTQLVLGNIAGLAVASGMDDESIRVHLWKRVHDMLGSALSDPKGKFFKSIERARDHLHFITPEGRNRN